MTSETIQKVLAALSIVIIITGLIYFMNWLDRRDAKLYTAAERYEACILDQYGMLPNIYYLEHNQYPVCDTE